MRDDLLTPPSARPRWGFIVTGAGFVALALIFNEWVLGPWMTVGGKVTNPASRLVVGAGDLLFLAVGITLLVRREKAPWRQMLLSAAATILAVVFAEGGLRAWFGLRSWLVPQDRRIARTIGWRPVANLSTETDWPGFGHVRYTTTRDGFRVYGDPQTTKRKLFVIGDSYTEAVTVSDGEAYYHRLGQARPDLEIFAIGGGGYGTLQEYMLLDEFIDEIRPDLVLVQLHPNDLINNSHALESRSPTDNNQMTRPYWEDGRVVSKFPENVAWGPLYNLVRHSYLLRLMNVNLVFLRSRSGGPIEQAFSREDPDVVRATQTTVELLARMRERARVPVAAFSARSETSYGFWSPSDVCRLAGVAFISGVGEAVDAAESAGERVTGQPIDPHWTASGHAIVARVLGAWLK